MILCNWCETNITQMAEPIEDGGAGFCSQECRLAWLQEVDPRSARLVVRANELRRAASELPDDNHFRKMLRAWLSAIAYWLVLFAAVNESAVPLHVGVVLAAVMLALPIGGLVYWKS